MYCSTCGVAVAQGLSYCNYCGAKLKVEKGDSVIRSREVKPELLVSSMVVVFIFGLAAITILMGVMKTALDLPAERVLGFAVVPFLIMLILEGVFVRLLLRRKHGAEEAGTATPLQGPATKELNAARARELPEPVPSVTEHTTRAFAPISNERTSKE